MMQDWRIDPFGYVRVLQVLQIYYGLENLKATSATKTNDVNVNKSSIIVDDNENNNEDNYSPSAKSYHSDSSKSGFDILRNIKLKEIQQKEFNKIERYLSELSTDSCFTEQSVIKVIARAQKLVESTPKSILADSKATIIQKNLSQDNY